MSRVHPPSHLPMDHQRLKRIGYVAVCTLLCGAAGVIFLVVAFLVAITSPFVLLGRPPGSGAPTELSLGDAEGSAADHKETTRFVGLLLLLLTVALGIVAICYWQAGVPGVLIAGAVLGGIGGAALGIAIVRGEDEGSL